METLANLESFVRSAETGGFSAAARRLSLTPAAVSRNVAMLERNLGIRLFQRSTRKLTLTEAGERFLHAIRGNLDELQASIASVATDRGEPAGVLRVSMGMTFGVEYILPLLPEFLKRYPRVRADWQFENRQVDLIAEGFDAAIGGGIDLAPGLVSRVLAPAHIIAVASPSYLKGRTPPADPSGLAAFDGIVMRSSKTRRVRERPMRNAAGEEMTVPLKSHYRVRRSGGDVPGSGARTRCDADRDGARAAAPGERCARAAGAAMVRRRGADLDLLRQPDADAGQDARLRRFRRGSISASTTCRAVCGQHWVVQALWVRYGSKAVMRSQRCNAHQR